jgi:2-methylcitrate dehydratase PrpD
MVIKKAVEKGDAASTFSRHFAATRYGDIPHEAVETVKKSVLDTLGVSIAATSLAPGCRELAELARETGGKEESTLLVFGGRVPASMAAWANGGLAHGLDFDDIYSEGPAHPSGAVVPAAFAVAERVAPTTGRDFITAIALGHDMVMRMTSSLHGDVALDNWLPFPLIGVFAAAASCGKLMGFDEGKIQSAVGIALAYSAGAMEIRRGNLRGLYDSWAAMGGVLSARMAEKGITGPAHPWEGERGFYYVYFGDNYERDILLDDLGTRFDGAKVGYKPWPSCASTHPCIDATLRLLQEHQLSADDIGEITVFVGTHALENCEPLDYLRTPKTILDAKFSVPFTVALACTRKRITLGDFTPEGIKDQAVLKLAERVVPKLEPKLTASHGLDPSIVEIKTKTGEKYSTRTDFVYGHYRNPMTMEAIIDKFKDCASYSATPLSQDRLEKAVAMVVKLEEMDDVSRIIRVLS